MVIGKSELSAILLVFGTVLSVYMALLAGPISAQANGEVTNGIIEEEITVEVDEDLREEVIINEPTRNKPVKPEPTVINIPNKPLPPTGGVPVYGIVAGCILAGAGLLGLGIGIRRGERR